MSTTYVCDRCRAPFLPGNDRNQGLARSLSIEFLVPGDGVRDRIRSYDLCGDCVDLLNDLLEPLPVENEDERLESMAEADKIAKNEP